MLVARGLETEHSAMLTIPLSRPLRGLEGEKNGVIFSGAMKQK